MDSKENILDDSLKLEDLLVIKTNLYVNIDIKGQTYKCVKQEITEQWEEDPKDSPKACHGAYSPAINGSFLWLLKDVFLCDSFNRKERDIAGTGQAEMVPHAAEKGLGWEVWRWW